eukprot:2091-Chlamydomonas_euryale.AAC.1
MLHCRGASVSSRESGGAGCSSLTGAAHASLVMCKSMRRSCKTGWTDGWMYGCVCCGVHVNVRTYVVGCV